MGYIYLYGMVMTTMSFLLDGEYPQADGYAAIDRKYHHLGGETGTAAAILANLGCKVVLGGAHLGNDNGQLILDTCRKFGIDASGLVREDYPGVIDYMIISGDTRTGFGEWQKLYAKKPPFYEQPDENAVKNCDIVGTDPFFGEEIVKQCLKYGKKYAVIDSPYNSLTHKNCAVDVISHEFLQSNYPELSLEEIYKLYTDNTDGLTIFTYGGGEVVYGRKGEPLKKFQTYRVKVVSTLGAGDSFKAGTIYALSKGMSDFDTVRYGCAVAGIACTKYPITFNPPTLEEVEGLIGSNEG